MIILRYAWRHLPEPSRLAASLDTLRGVLRRTVAGAVLLTALFAVACGDGPTPDPTATPTEAGTPVPVPGLPVLGPAPQDLLFEGVVEGIMTEASVSCVWFRGSEDREGRFQMAMDGLIGSERHRLRVVIHDYTGPGPYDWDGVPGSGPEVTAELDGEQRGHVVINVDQPGGSGDMDVTLTNPYQGRISGVWECPGVPR